MNSEGDVFSQSGLKNRQLQCRTLVYNMHKIKYEEHKLILWEETEIWWQRYIKLF